MDDDGLRVIRGLLAILDATPVGSVFGQTSAYDCCLPRQHRQHPPTSGGQHCAAITPPACSGARLPLQTSAIIQGHAPAGRSSPAPPCVRRWNARLAPPFYYRAVPLHTYALLAFGALARSTLINAAACWPRCRRCAAPPTTTHHRHRPPPPHIAPQHPACRLPHLSTYQTACHTWFIGRGRWGV